MGYELDRNKRDALWSFFASMPSYKQDEINHENCKRWMHTMQIAQFILPAAGAVNDCRVTCEPGKMVIEMTDSWEDHNSEDHIDFYKNSAMLIDGQTYQDLRKAAEKDSERWQDVSYLSYEFQRQKNCMDIMEEYAIFYSWALRDTPYTCRGQGIVARVKGIDAYFLFTLEKD